MNWALEPLCLREGSLEIRNYRPADFSDMAQALLDPEGWNAKRWKQDTPEKIQDVLRANFEAWSQGICNPLGYWVDGRPAGITRFHRIDARCRSLEIGGTWVAPAWQRTFVNTNVKFLLLKHAFETLACRRVEFRVNPDNHKSQKNVLRIGAQWEGRIRCSQMLVDGSSSDMFLYSIVEPDWPAVQQRLTDLRTKSYPGEVLMRSAF